jgi:hypothetical protein
MTTTEIRAKAQQLSTLLSDAKKLTHADGMLYIETAKALAQLEIAAQLSELNFKIDLFTVNQSPTFKSFAVTLMEQEEEVA